MRRQAIFCCLLGNLLACHTGVARTLSDLSPEELESAVRSTSAFELKQNILVEYQACPEGVLDGRSVDITLPLSFTYTVDSANAAATAAGNTINVSAPAIGIAAGFPEQATDTESAEGKLNLAEARELMPQLRVQFAALRDYFVAQPLEAGVRSSISDRLAQEVATTLGEELDVRPEVEVAEIPASANSLDMPDVALCDGTSISSRVVDSAAIPQSDGARGAFLFATSAVKPSGIEYLKDDDGEVLAYRPAQQDVSVDVVSLSVSAGADGETLEDGRSSKIIGGNPVTAGEMDSSVAFVNIKADGKKKNFCGGTVISDNWIATAAHCRVTPNSTVVLKRKKINSNDGHERQVKTVWRHIDFGKLANYDSDIALVELTAVADAPTASLYPDDVRVDEIVRVVGWGAQSVGGGSVEEMHEVDLKTVRNATCQAFYRPESNKVTENMVCALEQDADACQGDSGSGLFFEASADNYELVGIVSFGKGCANPAYPGVYTSVHKFADWIWKVQTATNIAGDLQ